MEVYIKSIPWWKQEEINQRFPQRIATVVKEPHTCGDYTISIDIPRKIGLNRKDFVPLELYNLPLYQTLMEIDCEA